MYEVTIPLVVLGPLGSAVAAIVVALWAKIRAVENERREWEDRWAREVKRGTSLAMQEFNDPLSLPPPDWEEKTEIRSMRSRLEQEALDKRLKDYANGITPVEIPTKKG